MNRLSKKFIIGIILILSLSTILSALLNQLFVPKYYLYQKRESLNEISLQLLDEVRKGKNADAVIEEIEQANKVLIVYTDSKTSDNDIINNEIRRAFQDKGVGFQKFWLWEEDYKDVLNGKNRIRLYKQDKLNYSLMLEYSSYGSGMFSVAMIIPDIEDAFYIINTCYIFISVLTIAISILFIIIIIKKIVFPLKMIENFAYHMGQNEFTGLEIHTHDELEQVAGTLNTMGEQIISYQESLKEKNSQMEQLLDNVAHDLKTPVSLIKLYTQGMKDGMDDGTFLDTIIKQNSHMNQMINKLLFLSRIDTEPIVKEDYDVSAQLRGILKQYGMPAKEQGLEFVQDITDGIIIAGNEEWGNSIFMNLITNAIKYASASVIEVVMQKNTEYATFIISNESDNSLLDLSKIWNPYYVGEESRNRHLSGTGLGLPIVKKMTERLGYGISCDFEKPRIIFSLKIPLE